jgi:hypothetical protein
MTLFLYMKPRVSFVLLDLSTPTSTR